MPWDALQRVRTAGLSVHSSFKEVIISKHPLSEWLLFDLTGEVPCVLTLREDAWTLRMFQWIPGPGPDDFMCEFPTLDEAVDAVFDFSRGTPTTLDGWMVPFHRHPELPRERVSSLLPQAVLVTAERFQQIEGEHENRRSRARQAADLPWKEWMDHVSELARNELSGKDEWERLRTVCALEDAGKVPKRPEPGRCSHYKWAMKTQFLPIQHAQDQTKSLRLRRDLQEMYLVAQTEPVRNLPYSVANHSAH